jgi:glycosyltransferase involved in cell wall biosynthesis
MPVHDTPAGFMRQAIDSVRAQSETPWELVIVLDAASDSCAAVAREAAAGEWKMRHPRLSNVIRLSRKALRRVWRAAGRRAGRQVPAMAPSVSR